MATHSSVLAWRIPGMGSLVGCHLWGCTESDMTEATQQQQQNSSTPFCPKVVLDLICDLSGRSSSCFCIYYSRIPSDPGSLQMVIALHRFSSWKYWEMERLQCSIILPIFFLVFRNQDRILVKTHTQLRSLFSNTYIQGKIF